jgi:hypothetical protein
VIFVVDYFDEISFTPEGEDREVIVVVALVGGAAPGATGKTGFPAPGSPPTCRLARRRLAVDVRSRP